MIRAKSGLFGAEIGKPSLGWLVAGPRRRAPTPCCVNLDVREPRHVADRMTFRRPASRRSARSDAALYSAAQQSPVTRLGMISLPTPLGVWRVERNMRVPDLPSCIKKTGRKA